MKPHPPHEKATEMTDQNTRVGRAERRRDLLVRARRLLHIWTRCDRPPDVELRDPIDAWLDEANEALRASPRDDSLYWTTTPPTRAGWYWYRRAESCADYHILGSSEPVCGLVYPYDDELVLQDVRWSPMQHTPIRDLVDYEWSQSPIEEPGLDTYVDPKQIVEQLTAPKEAK